MKYIKNKVKTSLSISRDLLIICYESVIDCFRYIKHSRTFGLDTKKKLEAAIIAHNHVLEKGLAMPERKQIFGESIARALEILLDRYEEKKYPHSVQIKSAYAVLYEYANQTNYPLGDSICKMNLQKADALSVGGAIIVNRDDYLTKAKGSFADLLQVRRSVRNYDHSSIDSEIIKEAVLMAQQSPSVCNRQATRVFWTTEKEKVSKILSLQNGNRGFGHLAAGLLIVTSELSVFEGAGERNQAWTDAGLFSMSLLYGLSFLGLGACPLNWCVDHQKDIALRHIVKIPNDQEIVMLITIGKLPEKFSITVSQRHDVTDILCHIK